MSVRKTSVWLRSDGNRVGQPLSCFCVMANWFYFFQCINNYCSCSFFGLLVTVSLGMLALLAFCIKSLSLGFIAGSGPLAFTEMVISFPILVKVLAMLPQRFIFFALRYSNALPMRLMFLRRQIYTKSIFDRGKSCRLQIHRLQVCQ